MGSSGIGLAKSKVGVGLAKLAILAILAGLWTMADSAALANLAFLRLMRGARMILARANTAWAAGDRESVDGSRRW